MKEHVLFLSTCNNTCVSICLFDSILLYQIHLSRNCNKVELCPGLKTSLEQQTTLIFFITSRNSTTTTTLCALYTWSKDSKHPIFAALFTHYEPKFSANSPWLMWQYHGVKTILKSDSYSRVHISWNDYFFKVVKKPSLMQN